MFNSVWFGVVFSQSCEATEQASPIKAHQLHWRGSLELMFSCSPILTQERANTFGAIKWTTMMDNLRTRFLHPVVGYLLGELCI